MKTVFTCKPSTLSEVSSIGGQNQNNGRDMIEYYVAAEKHLTAAEWCCFTDTLLNDRAWIAEFSAQKHLPDNGATPCLRVTGDGSEIVCSSTLPGTATHGTSASSELLNRAPQVHLQLPVRPAQKRITSPQGSQR